MSLLISFEANISLKISDLLGYGVKHKALVTNVTSIRSFSLHRCKTGITTFVKKRRKIAKIDKNMSTNHMNSFFSVSND